MALYKFRIIIIFWVLWPPYRF